MRDEFEKADGQLNPQVSAQQAMKPKLMQKFYSVVTVEELPVDDNNSENSEPGFAILLDGRKVKTPARRTMVLPVQKAAQVVADEWAAQEDKIDPAKMPATRLVNTACDGIVDDPQAVIEDMLKFASSDLLCYRASASPDLIELQQKHWDPILDWAETELGARFETTQNLIQIVQPKEAVAAIGSALRQWSDPVAIAALHTFTNLTGSVILALALAKGRIDAKQAWMLAHVDEDWNISKWGEDYEAQQRREYRWQEMNVADQLFKAITA